MAAYIVSDIEVTDPEAYEEYRRQVPATLEKFGGRFAVRGGAVEALEGDWTPHRIVVLEFPSAEAARAWHASPEYQAAAAIRYRTSKAHFMLLVEGAPPQV